MSDSLNAWPPRTRRLRIGDLCIDLHCRRVQRPDAEVELPQRMFELLLVFAAEPHTVHTRTALLQRVWPGVIVEDANLSQSVWILRRALGEARKDWIRTVAKKGYVFEPPTPVQAIETSAAAEAQAEDEQWPYASVVAISNASAGDVGHRERIDRKRPRRWVGYAAAAILIVIVATAGALHEAKPPEAMAGAQDISQTPASITLVEVDDPGMAPQHRLPAALLHAWLEWKFSALPEVTMLTQAHLAADTPVQASSVHASNVVVLIASGPLPDDPSRIFLQARFEDAHGPQRVRVEGTPAELGMLVDTVSRRVMQTLLPRRAQ